MIQNLLLMRHESAVGSRHQRLMEAQGGLYANTKDTRTHSSSRNVLFGNVEIHGMGLLLVQSLDQGRMEETDGCC